MSITIQAKFKMGEIYVTRSASNKISTEDCYKALKRHAAGDWGDLCDEDKALNEMSLTEGGRLFSAYKSAAGVKFWIITEADRSVTTILLPEDY